MKKILFSFIILSLFLTTPVFAEPIKLDSLKASAGETATNIFNKIESFRLDTLPKITETKEETKDRIESLTEKEEMPKDLGEATEKPIALIKLYLFIILEFIFGHKAAFYIIGLFLIFYIFRFIYRKLRGR